MNAHRYTLATFVFLGGIGSAFAQDGAPPPDNACPPGTIPQEETHYVTPPAPSAAPVVLRPVVAAPRKRAPMFAPNQIAVSLGGGVSDFVRTQARRATSVSGTWDVRLLVGARSPIAFEGGYLGTAGEVHDPLNDAALTTQSLFGGARLQLPWVVQPFISAGAGWIRLHRNSSNVESPIATANFPNRNDDAVVVPMGGGIAAYPLRHALIEARADYRLIAGAREFTPNGQRPDMWNAQLRAGYAF